MKTTAKSIMNNVVIFSSAIGFILFGSTAPYINYQSSAIILTILANIMLVLFVILLLIKKIERTKNQEVIK